jgi:hypothetical protein
MSCRLLFVLSDIHAGSTVGLCPPNFKTTEENEIVLNGPQRFLYECWEHMKNQWLPSIVRNDEWALVLNGDMIEGTHHKTKQVISPDRRDHVNAAVALLQPLTNSGDDEDAVAARIDNPASQVFLTLGTECHTGNSEHDIARILRATPPPNAPKNRMAWDRLDITIAGTRCVFQHHIVTSVRTYLEASGLGIFLNQEQLEAAKNLEPLPRVLGCAHRHRYGEFRDASGLSFVTPPWELLTRYGHKCVPAARTRPGGVILDWRNRPDGAIPEVHAITYRPPQDKAISI